MVIERRLPGQLINCWDGETGEWPKRILWYTYYYTLITSFLTLGHVYYTKHYIRFHKRIEANWLKTLSFFSLNPLRTYRIVFDLWVIATSMLRPFQTTILNSETLIFAQNHALCDIWPCHQQIFVVAVLLLSHSTSIYDKGHGMVWYGTGVGERFVKFEILNF